MKNVVLFRYSPRVVELWNLNNTNSIILANKSIKDKYDHSPIKVNEDIVRFIDNFDMSTLFREVSSIHKQEGIASVTSLSEEDVDKAGFLHSFFTKSKDEYSTSTLFKDKLYMRSALIDIVQQPKFVGLEESGLTKDELLEQGFNIVKPRSSAGSKGIYKLDSISDNDYKTLPVSEYMAESYVDSSRMLTCDGLAVGNEIVHFYIHEYDNMVLSSLTESSGLTIKTSTVYDEDPELLHTLFENTQKVINHFCCQSNVVNPFHFEWFIDSTKKPVFCEVGRRFGGMGIPRIIRYAFGQDILTDYWETLLSNDNKEKLNIVTSRNIKYPTLRAACYGHYKKSGQVLAAPTKDDFPEAENAWIWVKAGDIFESSSKIITDNSAIFELVADDDSELEKKLLRIQETMNTMLEYQC